MASPLDQVIRSRPGSVSATSQVASKPNAPNVARKRSSSIWRCTTGCSRPASTSARREVGAVDLLVPAGPGLGHRVVVVGAGEQVEVPHLRLAGHEQVDRAGQQHPGVGLPQRRVERRVDLVVDVLRAVQVLDVPATALDRLDEALDALVVEQALEVQQRDAVVAAQHRHGADALVEHLGDPALEDRGVVALEGVDDQSRQEEVVGHEALGCDRLVDPPRRRWSGSPGAAAARVRRPAP